MRIARPDSIFPILLGTRRRQTRYVTACTAENRRTPGAPGKSPVDAGTGRRSVTRFDITEGFGAPSADKSPGCAQHRSVARPSAARSASGDNDPATGGNEIHACKYQPRRSYVPNSMTPRPLPPPALGGGTRPCVPRGEGHSDRRHPARRKRAVDAYPAVAHSVRPDPIFPRVLAAPPSVASSACPHAPGKSPVAHPGRDAPPGLDSPIWLAIHRYRGKRTGGRSPGVPERVP